jgi:hypothetical protein
VDGLIPTRSLKAVSSASLIIFSKTHSVAGLAFRRRLGAVQHRLATSMPGIGRSPRPAGRIRLWPVRGRPDMDAPAQGRFQRKVDHNQENTFGRRSRLPAPAWRRPGAVQRRCTMPGIGRSPRPAGRIRLWPARGRPDFDTLAQGRFQRKVDHNQENTFGRRSRLPAPAWRRPAPLRDARHTAGRPHRQAGSGSLWNSEKPRMRNSKDIGPVDCVHCRRIFFMR